MKEMSLTHYARSSPRYPRRLTADEPIQNPDGERNGAARHAAKTPQLHRVLICEDQKDAAMSLALLVQLDGHEVRVAYDGASAIAEARNWRPTAAIIDIGLPGVTGYAVAQSIRALPSGAEALLIAVTGYGSPADVAMARYAGFDWHFVKPAHPSFIAEVLKRPDRERLHRGDGIPLKRGGN